MIKKIIDEVKSEWEKSKIKTGFMGVVFILGLLTYIKPQATSSIWMYLSLSAINFSILTLILVGVWIYFVRKRGGLRW